MTRIRRLALTAAVALAGASAAAAPAPAVTDGTSNTIMTARSGPAQARSCLIGITAIEFKSTGLGFMDYTDDACMAFAAGGQEGEE
jgi:hypothetical protein